MRKSKMKVYHGVPRSITDKYTVYYDSFDGKNNTFVNNTDYTFVDSPSGYAIKILDKNHMGYGIPLINNGLENQTIDCWFYSGTKTVDIFNFEDKTTSNDLINRSITLYYTLNDGIRLTNFLPGSSDQPRTITVPNTINIGWVHLRLTIIGNHVSLYVNGNLYHESLTKLRPFSSVWVGLYKGFGDNIDIKIPIISDLHISNIDRGDYFPNLPQDFIEGKAIIKPRIGQQQIKGDPMYSQVIKTKIPGTDWGKNHPYEIIDPDHARLRTNPEIVVSDSLNWNEGNTIEITGLNGEVVSGVIDTDTALARVVNRLTESEYVLNTVEGLSPTDKIRFYIGTSSSPECTISEVDNTNNIITLTGPLNGWDALPNYYVIETTTTSSTPILKTQDGDVKGTWSGLGTTKATFILGSNPDIKGKDFYIEYALNIPLGNSDFPELPHIVERAWGENGVEMKPITKFTIIDDFYGKKGGSLKECPHKMDRYFNFAFITPDTISDKSTYQDYYNKLASLNDNCIYTSTTVNTGRAQIAFDINLIEIVERKLGAPIPQANKIEWLKYNINQIRFYYYGYGKSVNGYKLYLTKYNTKQKKWNTTNASSTSSKVTSLRQIINPQYYEIDENGHIYFLAYADASDGNTPSIIYTDYVSIEIDIKLDADYTTLYCENTRAREDKCNPVLVQKETKTVKRYFPSKECFTTECTKLPYKDVSKVEAGKILSLLPYKIVTTNGTAGLTRDARGVDNYTDKVFLPSGYKSYQYDSSPIIVSETDNINAVSHTVKLPIIRYWGGRRYHGAGSTSIGLDSSQTITTKSDIDGKPMYEITAGLKNINGQLEMVVITSIRPSYNTEPAYNAISNDYILPNRPLIK